MEDCPLTRGLLRDPMRAREFKENHSRLPIMVRLLLWVIARARQ